MEKNLRKEILYFDMIAPSLNNYFSVIKNRKIAMVTRKKMIDSIAIEHSFFVKKIDQIISDYNIEPFRNVKIKLSYVPFYGSESKTYFDIKKRKTIKSKNRNPFDCVNYAPTMKVIEDRLVNAGVFEDDNYKIIISNEIKPAIIDRKYEGHGIFLIIEEVENNTKKDYSELLKLLKSATI